VKSQDIKSFDKFFAFFGKATPYGKIVKFCYESFHPLAD